jgi:hypothetical protein
MTLPQLRFEEHFCLACCLNSFNIAIDEGCIINIFKGINDKLRKSKNKFVIADKDTL